MMDMTEQTLMNELNKLLRKKFRQNIPDRPEEALPDPTEAPAQQQVEVDFKDSSYQEKDVIRLLLNYGNKEIEFEQENEDGEKIMVPVNIAHFIVNDLRADDISYSDAAYQKIFEAYIEFIDRDTLPDEKYFINHGNKSVASSAIDVLTSPYQLSEKWESIARIEVATEASKLKPAVENSVLSFKAKKIEILIAENQREIKEAEQEERYEALGELLKRQKELKDISKEINRQLGRVITR